MHNSLYNCANGYEVVRVSVVILKVNDVLYNVQCDDPGIKASTHRSEFSLIFAESWMGYLNNIR